MEQKKYILHTEELGNLREILLKEIGIEGLKFTYAMYLFYEYLLDQKHYCRFQVTSHKYFGYLRSRRLQSLDLKYFKSRLTEKERSEIEAIFEESLRSQYDTISKKIMSSTNKTYHFLKIENGAGSVLDDINKAYLYSLRSGPDDPPKIGLMVKRYLLLGFYSYVQANHLYETVGKCHQLFKNDSQDDWRHKKAYIRNNYILSGASIERRGVFWRRVLCMAQIIQEMGYTQWRCVFNNNYTLEDLYRYFPQKPASVLVESGFTMNASA